MFGRSLSAQIFTELMWRHSERPLLLERNGKNNFFHCKIRGIRLSSKKQSSAIGNQPTDDDTYLCKIFWDSHRKRERERERLAGWVIFKLGKSLFIKNTLFSECHSEPTQLTPTEAKTDFLKKLMTFLKKVFLFGQLFRVAIRYLVNYQSRLQGCHFLLLWNERICSVFQSTCSMWHFIILALCVLYSTFVNPSLCLFLSNAKWSDIFKSVLKAF